MIRAESGWQSLTKELAIRERGFGKARTALF